MFVSLTAFSRPKGFTLIEIMIVVLIISIITSVGVLTISHNGNKEMEYFAKELTQVIKLAQEQAMLQSAELGLMIKGQSYQFVMAQKTADNKNQWVALEDNALGKHVIPAHIQVTVDAPGSKRPEGETEEQQAARPQLVISSNGDVTPFTIYIGKKGVKPRFTISEDASGDVKREELQ